MEGYGKFWKAVEGHGTVEYSRTFSHVKVYKELTHTSKDKEPPPTIRPLLVIPFLAVPSDIFPPLLYSLHPFCPYIPYIPSLSCCVWLRY